MEDLIEGLVNVGILSVSYQIGQDAQRSLVKASEEKNYLVMLFSALVCGGSMYGFHWSARNLNRLARKYRARALPVYDLRKRKSKSKTEWYLPR